MNKIFWRCWPVVINLYKVTEELFYNSMPQCGIWSRARRMPQLSSGPSSYRLYPAAALVGSALGPFWLPWALFGRPERGGSRSAALAVQSGTHDAGSHPQI